MNSSSLSKLFSIFNETYELNPKSRAVLLALSKQHIKCELTDKLIQFVISSEYFVEAIPDFFYEIEMLNELILQKHSKLILISVMKTILIYFVNQHFKIIRKMIIIVSLLLQLLFCKLEMFIK